MVANAPSEEEMSSAKVRIVWTMVHNTEISEILDITGKRHASGDSVASFDPEFNRLSHLIKFGGRLWQAIANSYCRLSSLPQAVA
jgi:hypothetical protein